MATYGYSVLRHLDNARMLLLNANEAPPFLPAALRERVPYVPSDCSHDPDAVAQAIAREVRRTDGCLTILPNTGDTSWAATAAFLRDADDAVRDRVRVLGIVHSDMDTQYALARQYWPMAPVWIGVSARVARTLGELFACCDATVHALTYPIEIPRSARRDPDGPLRLAYVGRLEEPQKRVSRLVTLFAELGRRSIDFRATVAGDGPAARAFASTLAAAGGTVASRVDLRGPVTAPVVADIWRTHDVALLVSAYEGLPLALLEAMAAGACPVVMAIESGLPELLRDGYNARIVPQGDVDAMADVLSDLNDDSDTLHGLGAVARKTVADTLSPSAHFAALRRILTELAGTPPPAADAIGPDDTSRVLAATVDRLRMRGRHVAVFGAGMFGRKLIDRCLDANLHVAALFDSDARAAGTSYRGLRCSSPPAVAAARDVLFVAGSLEYGDEIAARIRAEFATAGQPAPEIVIPRR